MIWNRRFLQQRLHFHTAWDADSPIIAEQKIYVKELVAVVLAIVVDIYQLKKLKNDLIVM